MALANSLVLPGDGRDALFATPTAVRSKSKPAGVSGSGSGNGNAQAREQYRKSQVETASPMQLVVMLYDGAIRFCILATDAMSRHDLETQNTNLLKAQRIVAELMKTLNRDVGGEIAENLFRVYAHLLEELVAANLYDDVSKVQAVQTHLSELRETWREVDKVTLAAQGVGVVGETGGSDRHV